MRQGAISLGMLYDYNHVHCMTLYMLMLMNMYMYVCNGRALQILYIVIHLLYMYTDPFALHFMGSIYM